MGWYPSIDQQNYYRLFPNKFEKETFLNNVFFVPNQEAYKRYALDINFPINNPNLNHNLFKGVRIFEFIKPSPRKIKEIINDQILKSLLFKSG